MPCTGRPILFYEKSLDPHSTTPTAIYYLYEPVHAHAQLRRVSVTLSEQSVPAEYPPELSTNLQYQYLESFKSIILYTLT